MKKTYHILLIKSLLMFIGMHQKSVSAQFTLVPEYNLIKAHNKLDWKQSQRSVLTNYDDTERFAALGGGLSAYYDLSEKTSLGLTYNFESWDLKNAGTTGYAEKIRMQRMQASILFHLPGHKSRKFFYFLRLSSGIGLLNTEKINPFLLGYTSPYEHDIRWRFFTNNFETGAWYTIIPEILYLQVQLGYCLELSVNSTLVRTVDDREEDLDSQIINRNAFVGLGLVVRLPESNSSASKENQTSEEK